MVINGLLHDSSNRSIIHSSIIIYLLLYMQEYYTSCHGNLYQGDGRYQSVACTNSATSNDERTNGHAAHVHYIKANGLNNSGVVRQIIA